MTIRIAMWSGPRNISTAMMRSWENRADTNVVDEPFYAYYLAKTQSPHPMFDVVLASQSQDYDTVANELQTGACTSPIQYQKHMTQHMLPNCDLAWTSTLQHCFLIREPAQVVASYTRSRGECSAQDIGIIRQYELYQTISKLSKQRIPVIDSQAVLQDPSTVLSRLCQSLNIEFDQGMLNWPAGKRNSDGVWASHWYHSVEASTGFAPPAETKVHLNSAQQKVVDEVTPYYQ